MTHLTKTQALRKERIANQGRNPTVGKGTLLSDADSAATLPFRHRATGEPASEDEVRAEFDLIAGMEASTDHAAEYYEDFTELYLSQDAIDRLVQDHMRGDFPALLRLYPKFGNLPLSAQIALWDMIYNVGSPNLRTEFPRLRQAILDEDWEEAAQQSHRLGISEARNQYVFDLFMDAATEAAEEP